MSSMGALVVEVQGNAARTQEDMGKIVNVIDASARRINTSAKGASDAISNIGRAGRNIGRIKGAEDAAKSIDKIGHSSTAARREMLVLAHELSMGNFKRFGGSLMVLGEQMDWMGKIMSPTGLAIGAVTLTLGGLAVAAYKGAQAHAEFNKALIATGNYAGLTEDRFNALTDRVGESAHVTVMTAREITQGLLQTGQIGGGALEHVATAAALMATLTGAKAEDVVKDFAKMSDGVLKWALEADKQYHFMTGALYDNIKALEENGQKEQAMIVASDALTAAKKRQAEQLGETHSAWELFKADVADTADQIEKFLGRLPTLAERIEGVRAALANAPKEGGLLAQGVQRGAQRSTLTGQLTDLVSQQRSQQEAADYDAWSKGEAAKTVKFKQEWDQRVKTAHIGVSEMEAEIKKAREEGEGAGASKTDIEAMVAHIRKQYTHKDAGASGIERANTAQALQPLQAQISGEEKLLAYRERALQGYYKADRISIQGYYDTRRTVIEAANTRLASLYDQEIGIAESHAARSTDARAKIEAVTKANELRDQKQAALLASSEALAQADFEQAEATEHYRDEVTKLNAELDKLRHTPSNSAADDFERAHGALRKQATAADDTGTLATLDQAKDAAVAQANMNTLKERATLLENALKQAEAQTQLQVQTGQKTEVEGMLRTSVARKESAAQLAAIAEQMQAIADKSGLPELQDQAAQFKLQVDQIQASSDVLGKSVSDVFATSFASSLLAVQNRTKSLKQAFLDMANAIEQALLRIVDNDIAQMLFSNNGGGSAGGGGGMGLFGKLVGLAVTAFGGAAGGDMGSENIGASDTSTPDDLISGYRATGGPVLRGSMYQVNERGPELLTVANKTYLMTGDKGGAVTPINGLAASNGRQSVFNMNIQVPPGTTRQSASQQAAEIMRHAQLAQARNA